MRAATSSASRRWPRWSARRTSISRSPRPISGSELRQRRGFDLMCRNPRRHPLMDGMDEIIAPGEPAGPVEHRAEAALLPLEDADILLGDADPALVIERGVVSEIRQLSGGTREAAAQ